jgi:hypothetical protein
MAFEIQLARQSTPINVPVGPLVTPAEPIVDSNTAESVLRSISEGLFTGGKLVDEFGKLGQAERAAKLQAAREVIDPNAIAARAEALKAARAKTLLEAGMATEALPNVALRAATERAKLEREKADVWRGDALKSYEESGRAPVYFQQEDGTESDEVDVEQTAALGAHMKSSKSQMTEAAQMLKGEQQKVWDSGLQQEVVRYVNVMGQDVSPGSDAHKFWTKQFQDGYKKYYNPPKVKPRAKGGKVETAKEERNAQLAAAESATTAGLVAPKAISGPTFAPTPGTEYAAAAQSLTFPGVASARSVLTGPAGGLSEAQVAQMTDQQVADAWRGLQVAAPGTVGRVMIAPALPQPQPLVTPQETAPVAQFPGAFPAGPKEPSKYVEAVAKQPGYTDWAEKIVPMQNFATAAKRIQEGPTTAAEKGPLGLANMRQKDLALIQSLRQLSVQTQAATGRALPEMQTKAIEDQMSLFEKLGDWKQTVTGTGTLSPGTRERMIKFGNDLIRARELTVLPALQWAVQDSGLDADQIWGPNSFQKKLLEGGSMAVPEVPIGHGGSGVAHEANGEMRLPSGRRIVYPGR